MFVRVFLFAALAVAAALAEDDVTCYDVGSVIEEKVFSQIRKYLVSSSSDYKHLSNYEFSLMGYGAGIIGGRVGNLSDFAPDVINEQKSSTVCVDKTSKQEYVDLHITFDELDLIFDDFFVHFPLIGIGDTKTTFSLKGAQIFVEVGLFKDEKGEKCKTAQLTKFEFRQFGTLKIDFESGLLNKLYGFILNYLAEDIVSAIEFSGVGSWIGSDGKIFLTPIVREHEANFCSLY
ncbi:Hypothetical protein NTJ_04493 [Nesidiocoris tenuis]|uniref:Lipid-binding serum glycoprotein N-terminal domain-containing protein n=1 Tax=Nesidiocoris tenuis TaxID=355587 RepID=A0ABN7AHF1_9HEMI|nr:Hypothetical protein NTJ_04493 [Nesidiocoris tenuis]